MKIELNLIFVLSLGLLVAACNSSDSSFSAPRSGSSVAVVNLPKTGQSNCYDGAGASIACVGTGQDGDLLKGAAWPTPRFVDNGDGTVTDSLTGLMWVKEANCIGDIHPAFDVDGTAGDGYVSWQIGLDFVADLNAATYDCGVTGGYTDWRLPNRKELWSLVDLGQTNPALPVGHPFSGVVSSGYWSSSSNEAGPDYAWWVSFHDGNVLWGDKVTNTSPVWLVRAGQ